MQELFFALGVIDKVSGPVGKIQGRIQSTTSAISQLTSGVMRLAASGMGMRALTMPAIEMERALGEVRSLGVTEEAIQKLNRTALALGPSLGVSASETVRAAYDIQSSIAGLTGDELAAFTKNAAVMAMGTKANVATVTDFMGTMVNIFEKDAARMGRAQWVEQLAGQFSGSIKQFKTTGTEMSQAFKALGASAQSAGLSMAEQFAVLGQLQATMSGAEAGTKFTSFLVNAAEAGETLGLRFTGAQGRLLPVVEVLEELRGKYGATLDELEKRQIKKAFGRIEAVKMVELLMNKTGALRKNIAALGETKFAASLKMAKTIADPWQRMGAATKNLSIVIGQALLPVLVPMVEWMTGAVKAVMVWAQEHPVLARAIGLTMLALAGLTAALGVVALILVLASWMRIAALATLAWKGAVWLLNTAFWANPITWIVAGVVALVAAVAAAIYWWGRWTSALRNTGPIQWVIEQLNHLIELLNLIPGIEIPLIETKAPKVPQVPEVAVPKIATAQPLAQPRELTPPGGVLGEIRQTMQSLIGTPAGGGAAQTVKVYTSQPATPELVQQYLRLQPR